MSYDSRSSHLMTLKDIHHNGEMGLVLWYNQNPGYHGFQCCLAGTSTGVPAMIIYYPVEDNGISPCCESLVVGNCYVLERTA